MERVLDAVASWAKAGSEPAFVLAESTISYAELDRQSDALAACLSDAGLAPGDHIVVLRRTMPAAFVTTLAACKSGIVFLLIDARDGDARKTDLMAQIDPRRVLIETDEDAAFAASLGYTPLDLRLVPDAPFSRPILDPKAPCWLEATSGSTGTAKLVLSNRETLEHLCFAQTQAAGFAKGDRVALFGEMWVDTLMNLLIAGVTMHPYDLKANGIAPLPDWMRANRITGVQTFVAAFRSLAQATDGRLPDFRIVRIAGEVVTDLDVRQFEALCPEDAVLTNFYGSTECGFIAEYKHRPGNSLPGPTLPIGTAIPGTRIEIVDENHTPLPDGVTGLMLVKSRYLADGYLNTPDKTKATYWSEPDGTRVLNTGDLAVRQENGLVCVVGRADDQVKIRGYSVRYSDAEAILRDHPDLAACVVTSFLSPRGQRQLAAHVILEPGRTMNAAELRAYMAGRGPSYLVPSYFVPHDDFPRTDTGKVLRRALPNPLDVLPPAPDQTADLTGTRAVVAEVWKDTLGHAGFGTDEDFFDVGGDSLQAMAMVVALERRLKVRIGYETLIMQGATVDAIAARLDAGALPARIIDLKTGTADTPVYVMPVENGEFSDWLYVMPHLGPDLPLKGVHVRDLSQRDQFPRLSQRELGSYAARSIIDADPHGPYIIAGFSAGCQTAVECVRALQSAGKEIAGLMLVDPPVLPLEPYRRTWWMRRIFSPLVKQRDLSTTWDRLAHIALGRPTRELHIADETTFWTYRPKPCRIDTALMLSARDLNPHRASKEAAWLGILGPNLTVVETPGDHITVVRDPHAAVLARTLDRWWRGIVEKLSSDAA